MFGLQLKHNLTILIVSASSSVSAQVAPVQPFKTDVVELVAERVADGLDEFVVEHDGIAYYFANNDNRNRFLENPAIYEVADGGACGSMGPLSGLGSAERFAVHDGRVYFFASDSCKTRFLQDPSRCIETKPCACADRT